MATGGLKSAQLLGAHPPSHRLKRPAARGRQRADVDLRGLELEQAQVTSHLDPQLPDPGSGRSAPQLGKLARTAALSVQKAVELSPSSSGELVAEDRLYVPVGVAARGADHPQQRLHRRAQHPASPEVLGRERHQRRRRVVLDRALTQPRGQAGVLLAAGPVPAFVGEHEL